ncbi:putative Diguanylate cyclase [Candidatus Propionivibrio aalborgensis]|uniref:Putative Diguanylate cyclase n=1 Tax=Candidatus Propionivibrio aalborgensis TaxID=1860101 RepID=A0A1A8Y242_9RHOO|nr:diguanylate cyclase [Candidatus Propionivibrio aalborgensis]SBT11205.1 putative Diguanylate cyclase [Candidatus Propionivibrio aalborgensis]
MYSFSHPSAGQRRRFLLVGGSYVVLWIAIWHTAGLLDQNSVSLWYLPAGLRFCCLLLFGWRGLLLELLANMACGLLQIPIPTDLPAAFLSAQPHWLIYGWFAPVFAYAVVLLPWRRLKHDALDFARPADVALFILAALAASTLAASAGTFRLAHVGFIPQAQWPEVLANWLIGDFIGIIVLAPFLMVRVWPGLQHYLQTGHWAHFRKPRNGNGDSDLHTVLIAVSALLLVFGIPWSWGLNTHFPLIALLLLLPLAGLALRHGLRSAVLAAALLDCGLVMLIALYGQFGLALQYQIVMIAIALVGLWLGGAVDAHKRITLRYRDFASISNDLLWEADAAGRLSEASGRLAQDAALSPGQYWRDLLSASSQPQLMALEHALSEQQLFHHQEVLLKGAGDSPIWVKINGLPLRDDSGRLTGYRGTAVDITRSRRAEAVLHNYNEELLREVAERTRELAQSNSELATKELHLQVLLAAAPVGVLELDDAQCCRFINVNGCAMIGYAQEEAQGRPVLDFVLPDDHDYVEFVLKINRQNDAVHWLEFRLARTGLRCSAHCLNLGGSDKPDQPMSGMIMVLTNATARSQQDERLWTLAHYDALTDLPNRILFWDRVEQALRHAKRLDSGAAMLWIDLDGFKGVNDHLGHAVGDALLQQVAQRLKGRIRDSDTLARMGGDEFAVIMPGITASESASHVATELVASLAEPFDLPQGTAHISGSIGVGLYPQHADSVESLTQCADMAMYSAKTSGKNQVQVWKD